MTTLTVAAAQSRISSDIATNGETVRRQMREAARAGARLVQFPEGALSGYAVEQIRSSTGRRSTGRSCAASSTPSHGSRPSCGCGSCWAVHTRSPLRTARTTAST